MALLKAGGYCPGEGGGRVKGEALKLVAWSGSPQAKTPVPHPRDAAHCIPWLPSAPPPLPLSPLTQLLLALQPPPLPPPPPPPPNAAERRRRYRRRGTATASTTTTSGRSADQAERGRCCRHIPTTPRPSRTRSGTQRGRWHRRGATPSTAQRSGHRTAQAQYSTQRWHGTAQHQSRLERHTAWHGEPHSTQTTQGATRAEDCDDG